MKLLETVHWTQAQREAFEDECFASWLNKIDAITDYEWRRQTALLVWRHYFDAGECEQDAIRKVLKNRERVRNNLFRGFV